MVKKVALFVTLALIGFAATVGIMLAREPVPPPPPWVNADGTIDMEKMPDRLPLIGLTGEVIGTVKNEKTPPYIPGMGTPVPELPDNDAITVIKGGFPDDENGLS